VDALTFDAGANLLLDGGLSGSGELLLSTRVVVDPLEAGEVPFHKRSDVLGGGAGVGEITGTGYARQPVSMAAALAGVKQVPTATWSTAAHGDWLTPVSAVLVKGGVAVAAWNLREGGIPRVASANTTIKFGSSFTMPGFAAPGTHYGPGAVEVVAPFAPTTGTSPLSVLMIHGGGWNLQENMGTQARELRAAGYFVATMNYVEAAAGGPAAFPIQIQNVEAAYSWMLSHASEYKGSPSKVVILGASSGGHIGWTAAIKLLAGGATALKAVITLSAAGYDLVKLLEEANKGEQKNAVWTSDLPIAVGTTTPALALTEPYKAVAKANSPHQLVNSTNRPPKCLIYNSNGGETVPISQQREMKPVLEAAGCATTAVEIPGKAHAVAYWSTVLPEILNYLETV
jgi:acetyl esterase/lipase